MSVIRLQNVSKIYDDNGIPVKALNGINLEIEAGEFTAIVGPSGSGKSTLLNLIGGLDVPSSGTIFVEEFELNRLKSSELVNLRLKRIGFVFQAFNLIPVLTALENVEFIMLLQGKPRHEREKRALELLVSVGLGDQTHRRPTELSGGQQQRVAVARALASLPAFILADEPTANLDSTAASNLLDIMERLNHEHNMTFIFSTHDARVVQRARRIITLEDGAVLSDMEIKNP